MVKTCIVCIVLMNCIEFLVFNNFVKNDCQLIRARSNGFGSWSQQRIKQLISKLGPVGSPWVAFPTANADPSCARLQFQEQKRNQPHFKGSWREKDSLHQLTLVERTMVYRLDKVCEWGRRREKGVIVSRKAPLGCGRRWGAVRGWCPTSGPPLLTESGGLLDGETQPLRPLRPFSKPKNCVPSLVSQLQVRGSRFLRWSGSADWDVSWHRNRKVSERVKVVAKGKCWNWRMQNRWTLSSKKMKRVVSDVQDILPEQDLFSSSMIGSALWS